MEDHLRALTRPERGPLCQRCGIGASYGGALDARGWRGWCQAEAAAAHTPHALAVIGRIAPHEATP